MQILFYSNYCQYSAKCINELDLKGILNKFKKICVDKDPRTKQRNPDVTKYGIKSVPTIVLGDQKLSGTNVFGWINQIGSNNTGQSTRMERFQQPNKQDAPPVPKDPEGFDFGSQFGFASAFDGSNLINPPSETGDTVQKQSSFQIPGSILNKTEKEFSGGGGSDESKKASNFNRDLENLMKERENSLPKLEKMI